MVRLRLLGGAFLEDADGPLTGAPAQRHRVALLALLALSRVPAVRRDRLVALLWPERDEAHARNLLSQAVHALRRALGAEAVVSGADELHLAPGALICDVTDFEEAVASGDLDVAVALYRGSLLDGFHLPRAPGFDAWLGEERKRLQGSYEGVLAKVAEGAEARGDWADAVRWWRRLMGEDPCRARVTLRLMDALTAAGDRAGAIREAGAHGRAMKERLGAGPDPEVVRRADALRKGPDEEGDGEPGGGGGITGWEGAPADRPGAPIAVSSGLRWSASGAPALVGRQTELEQLREAWRAASRVGPHLAFVRGEAGIGKTRVAEEFLAWAARRGITVARSGCYAAEGGLAYGPIADWLRSPSLRPAFRELDKASLVELTRLVPELARERPDLPDPDPLMEGWQRSRLFAALARAVLAGGGPRILLADDLQWGDRDTIQWLHYLLRFEPGAALLVVGTARPGELGDEHPVTRLLADLQREGRATGIPLGPLEEADTVRLASRVAGRDLSPEVAAALYRESEGNPLFIVEMVRAGWADGVRKAPPAGKGPPVPPRVQAVIRSRFAQITPRSRETVEVAAVLGRDFPFELLRRITHEDEESVAMAVEELLTRRILRDHGAGRYDFSHDRLREEAYRELGSARRLLLHRRAAEALAGLQGSVSGAAAGEIARHLERGGLPEKAIPHHARAAEAAMGMLAYERAVGHLRRALALLSSRPEGEDRDRQELSLVILLVMGERLTRGWASSAVYEGLLQARALCRRLGDRDELFQVLVGLQSYTFVKGTDLGASLELLEEVRPLARARGDPPSLGLYEFQAGSTLCQVGDFGPALEHLERSLALYDPPRHRREISFYGGDPGVLSHAFAAHVLWHLGHPDRAVARSRISTALAESLDDPFSLALAHAYAAMLHLFRDEPDEAEADAESTMALSEEYGFAYYHGWGTLIRGWARTRRPGTKGGIPLMRKGMAAIEATGAELRKPFYLALQAEAEGRVGRFQRGLALLDEAAAAAARSGERWKDAEILRLRGALLLGLRDGTEPGYGEGMGKAESAFREGLEVAQRQGARSLALRAATGLAELLGRGGSGEEGRRILAPHLSGFTEDSETPDLRRAQEVLEGLE